MNRPGGMTSRSEGTRRDSGVALILVLLSMLVLSVLAATIVFTARSETLASYNFKLDTQADYLAKAGIQQAVNWFRSTHYAAVSQSLANTDYKVHSTGAPYNLWTSDTSPVTCISGCSVSNSQVQLIGYTSPAVSGSTNYPNINNTDASPVAVTTSFTNYLVNQRVSGDANNSGTYSVNAVLVNYQTVNSGLPPSVTPVPLETWLITAKATWTGGSSMSATLGVAEELAIIQPIYNPTWGTAIYAYCGVTMNGSSGVCTDAFNSGLGAYGGGNASVAAKGCDSSSTNVIQAGADVGANGGVSLGNNVTVSGNVLIGSGPSSGCSASGFSGSSSSVLGEVLTNAPHIAPPPVPTFPAGFPTGAPNVSSGTWPQTAGGSSSGTTTLTPPVATYTQPCASGFTCNGTASNPYLISSLGGATLTGGPDIFHPVYYDIDSISISGNTVITVSGYVVWNVKTTLSLKGNGVANSLVNPPESCQINFAGTSADIGGNGATSAVLTAPLADVNLKGGGSKGYMVGSVRANNVTMQGGEPLHYDIQLARDGGVVGISITTGYSRKKM